MKGRPTHGCGRCDARWWGAGIAHCSACHLTFGGITSFDAHRQGGADHRRCLTVTELADRGITPGRGGVMVQETRFGAEKGDTETGINE